MINPINNNNKNNWGYYVDIETQTILNEDTILFLDVPIISAQIKQPFKPHKPQELPKSEKQKNHLISYIGLTFIVCIIISF